jgi:single-strand DNA-binding protein
MSLAKVTLIGNLGRDPEVRYTPSGAMNVTFSVATSRRWRDSSGQDQENTTWFRITAWGRLAETMVNLQERGALVKGRQVYVEGRIEAREYTGNDGQVRTSLDVTANEMQLLGNRADNQESESFGGGGGPFVGGGGQRQNQSPSFDDEGSQDMNDVPF